jgi:hypothetical protein
MSRKPLGVFGIDTDPVSGQPRAVTQKEKQAELGQRETKAIQESVQMAQELPLVLSIIARQLDNRIVELINSDPLCNHILQIVGVFRNKVEFAADAAVKRRRQAFGPVLNSMTDETKAAPEGIPASE